MEEIADGCEELPAYAPRRAATAYVLEGAGWIALYGAVLAGVLAAMGIARLMAVRRLHRLEQARQVRLSVGLGRGQRRRPTFYARPDLGI